MPMESIVLIMRIVVLTNLIDSSAVEKRLSELAELEEDCFIIGFHHHVQKVPRKAWNEKQIKKKKFQMGDLIFLQDNKFLQHPGKLQMHLLVSYVIRFMTEASLVQLEKFNGEITEGLVNNSRLKLYRDNHASVHYSGYVVCVPQYMYYIVLQKRKIKRNKTS